MTIQRMKTHTGIVTVVISKEHLLGKDEICAPMIECPKCGLESFIHYNYCPHCGVKFDISDEIKDIAESL